MKAILMIGFLMLTLTVAAYGSEKQCSTDLDCESLCCHSETGACAPHNPAGNFFCNKPTGEMCIASEYCMKSSVIECKVVKNGRNSDGSQACTMRCLTVIKPGRCIDYVCASAELSPVPEFDPKDCSNSVDP